MRKNLESSNGLVFSQSVLLALVETGLTRDQAYRIVQRNAMQAWDDKGHLRDLLAADPEVTLTEEELAACFSLDRITETAAPVFQRLAALDQPRS
jgi:adenylosuccinate lyase